MHLDIGMTTAPRPEPYITRSVASLRAAGFDQTVHYFAEPGSTFPGVDPYPPDGVLHAATVPFGCFPNWRRALHRLADHAERPDDFIMVVQDDVVWCKGARAILDRFLSGILPGLGGPCRPFGFASPYASPAVVAAIHKEDYEDDRRGQSWVPPLFYNKSFWGALALVFTAESAYALLEHPRFVAHDHHRKVDVVVGNCMRDMGREMTVALPSLCDHIGAHSTLGRHRISGIQWGRRGYRFDPDWEGGP
jgi:hypothetical protein